MEKGYSFSKEERKVLENMRIPLCVYQKTEGRIIMLVASVGAARLLNCSSAELIHYFNTDRDKIVSQETQKLVCTYENQSIILSGQEIRHFFELKALGSAEGEYKHCICYAEVEKRGKAELIFANYQDITEEFLQKEAQKETHEKTSLLLQKILETTQTAIFWKDADRRFLGANKAFLDYYGFASEDAILGKNDEEMGWHTDPDPFKNDEYRVIKQGQSTYRVHGKCMLHGENRDIVASKNPMYQDGRIIGLVGSFEDVTDEYRQKLEISELNTKLLKALENEAKANTIKSEFLARMSHDMRTPMTTVIGLSSLGIDENRNQKDVEYFKQIKSSSEYLLALLNDILDMQKLESGKVELSPQVCLVEETAQKIDTIVRTYAERKKMDYQMQSEIAPDCRYLFLDERHLEQILINVLNNAIKYTPAGGNVKWLCKATVSKDGGVLMTNIIQDNGVGISADFQKHMYEAFTQENNILSRSETGTGLGLAIVKKTVEKMGGTIACESELEKGTCFTICLPEKCASQEQIDAYETQRQEERNKNADLNGKKILLCEDVAINAKIVTLLLRSKGMEVEWAQDGAEGVEKFKAGKYDAVLMDIRMLGMNGLEATKAIRSFDTETPIIALSANAYKEDILKSLAAGMNAHVAKPINMNELMTVLQKYIRENDE